VEYAILVGFIAVVAAAAVYRLGRLVLTLFGLGEDAFG
jgi:Flp pilus assembly pilin Flp